MDVRRAWAFMQNVDAQLYALLDIVRGWRIHVAPPSKEILKALANARRMGILPEFETWMTTHYGTFKEPKKARCPKRFTHVSNMLTEVLGHTSEVMTLKRAACITRHGEQLDKLETLLHWIDHNFDLREQSPDVS